MRIVVVEPDGQGRQSGGYLYNQQLAEHGAFEVVRGTPSVEAALARLPEFRDALILADSLFLDDAGMAPFLALRARGARVGALLHAFPSFIERASDREALARALPLRPLPGEVALLERLELVVTPGRYVARVLGDARCSTPCVVCPPGVSPVPRGRAFTVKDTDLGLLVVAHQTPAKGVLDALRALAALRDHPWRLSLVGAVDANPTYTAALREEVNRAGLAGRVRFRGQLPHAEALAELGSSSVLLIASFTENCPLVALEALRAGVPVVGYAVGGLPDLVPSGVAGILVPELDVNALREALRRVLTVAGEHERLARGARSAGAALLSWAEAAADFQRALRPYE